MALCCLPRHAVALPNHHPSASVRDGGWEVLSGTTTQGWCAAVRGGCRVALGGEGPCLERRNNEAETKSSRASKRRPLRSRTAKPQPPHRKIPIRRCIQPMHAGITPAACPLHRMHVCYGPSRPGFFEGNRSAEGAEGGSLYRALSLGHPRNARGTSFSTRGFLCWCLPLLLLVVFGPFGAALWCWMR